MLRLAIFFRSFSADYGLNKVLSSKSVKFYGKIAKRISAKLRNENSLEVTGVS